MVPVNIEYHYDVQHETTQNYYVHGDSPNYSPCNVTVYQGTTPKWVLDVPLPPEEKPKEWGVRNNWCLLLDSQLNIAESTTYTHQVYKIWNSFDAEELSNLMISFEPTKEKLTLHSCFIERNGVRINKLDMSELRIIQPEDEHLIYSGTLSAIMFLEDIRPGDILEYSFSSVISNQNLPVGYGLPLQFPCSWNKLYRRIIKAPGHSYQINYPSDWKSYLHEEPQEYIWEIEPSPRCHTEHDQPPGYVSSATFEISESKNWNDYVRKLTSLYQLNTAFDQDPEVIGLINSWRSSFSSVEEQALAALRFVQDEVRYLGLEDGLKGFVPSAPLLTLKRRFGDCKGKTQLFRAFLNALEIPSYACLVSTTKQKGIKNCLPNNIFNHVITCIVLSDELVFVDPTSIYEGGTLRDSSLPYGYGLIVSEKTQDLTPIPQPIVHPEINCSTSLILSDDQAEMQITVHAYGNQANDWRYRVNHSGANHLLENYRMELESQFDSVQIKNSVQINDDREHNHICATASFIISNPWIFFKEYDQELFYFKPIFLSQYTDPIETNRETPYYLPHARIKESISIDDGIIGTDNETIDNDTFTLKVEVSGNKVEYDLFTHRDTIPSDQIESLSNELNKARDALVFFVMRKAKNSQ